MLPSIDLFYYGPWKEDRIGKVMGTGKMEKRAFNEISGDCWELEYIRGPR